MACAHAKFTGEVGVCMATSGPGAIHLLNGLYDAKLDHQPVVAIVGQQARVGARRRLPAGGRPRLAVQGRRARVRADGHRRRRRSRHLIDRAMRIARAERTRDVRDRPQRRAGAGRGGAPPREHGTVHSGVGYAAPRVVPHDDDLERAADILNEGEQVAILSAPGALDAADEVDRGRRAARRRRREGAARQGGAARRPAVRHRLDRPARHQAELGHDAGLRHAADGRLELPVLRVPAQGGPGARRADRHRPAQLGLRYPMEVNLVGDARDTLRRCCPLLAAQGRPRAGARASRRACATGGSCSRSARTARPTRSIRSSSSASCRRGCPTTASSPPTPARRPTGRRAT